MVELRWKSNKHISNTPRGKEVIAIEVVSNVTPCNELVPSACDGVVGPLGVGAVVCAGVDSVATSCLAPSTLGEGPLVETPYDVPPLGETVKRNRKHHHQRNHANSRRVSLSPTL
ncbi:hypothetical protein D5086_005911 [Populus alba]|uniref:Uncharacterized protein n=2 Tax=Populus TaxID=3689 RepID=A0ACC4CVC3_POPAL|nr:hypothetical protein NC653_007129 [Populus alba x Populus x berolinensis]